MARVPMEIHNSEITTTDPSPRLPSPNDVDDDDDDETEIEYYSTDHEDDEDSDDYILDDSSSSCENLRHHHHPPLHQQAAPNQCHYHHPRVASPRGQSSDHQSMTSTDAFSLPVGTQEEDDVSSLEGNDDPVVRVYSRPDYFRTISDSLKEDREENAPNDNEMDRITQFPSPVSVNSSPTQEQQPAVAAQNTSIPSKSALVGRSELVLDDEQDASVQSIRELNGFRSSVDKEGCVNGDAEMEDLTRRMHRSMYLIPSQSSFLYDEGTPEHASIRLVMDDLTLNLKEYAKNFPPELDFEEAQKYLLQLADGIPDTLGSRRESTSSSGLTHRRITTPGSHSEYTEIIVEHDDDVRMNPRVARTSPHGHGAWGAPCYSPKESVLSYDYTEIVVESWEEDEIIVEDIIEDDEAY